MFKPVSQVEIKAKLLATEFLHRHNAMEYSFGTFVSNYMKVVMKDHMPLGFSR